MINAPLRQDEKLPSRSRASFELLAHRTRMLPDVAWQLLTSSIVFPTIERVASRRIVITGAGASEGAGRYLAAVLRNDLMLRAGFVPLSAFVEPVRKSGDDILIVFSQGISPNARLALRQARQFGMTVLFTTIHPEGRSAEARLVSDLRKEGTVVHVLPPEDESGPLLRILGPAMATLGGLLMAKSIAAQLRTPLADDALPLLPDHLATARARATQASEGLDPEWAHRRWALITAGTYGELCDGLRWKWSQGLQIAAPPLWDVLQVPHGPFQQIYLEPVTLVALERSDASDGRIFDRLEKILVPGRHKLVRVQSVLGGNAAYFDHDAQCNWLLLRSLEARPTDLSIWPGKGMDGPLYELGRDFT